MSQSPVSEPSEEDVEIAGLEAGVEVPEPLPTESIVRRGVNGDIFITLRQIGEEPAIHILREQDATDLYQLLETALNNPEYRQRRGEPADETPSSEGDERPLSDEQTHRLLAELPVEADMEPIRQWLLGDRKREDIGYREWIRFLQQSGMCIKWSTEARGVAGYAEWDDEAAASESDTDNLRVQLSTGTTTTGERAVEVLVDIVDEPDTTVTPIDRAEAPFADTNGGK